MNDEIIQKLVAVVARQSDLHILVVTTLVEVAKILAHDQRGAILDSIQKLLDENRAENAAMKELTAELDRYFNGQ